MMEKKCVGILIGDSSGVGPEIVAEVAAKGFLTQELNPVIIGDVRQFEQGLKVVGRECPHYVLGESFELDYSKGIPIYDTKDQDPEKVVMGKAQPYCGSGDISQLKAACKLAKGGKIAGFCYGPFHKGAMRSAGMEVESEAELMAKEFGIEGPIGEVNMIGDLMTFRVTSHIPVKEISAHLNVENIFKTIELGCKTSKSFGVKEPRIAVAGLNPHNGEGGKCGTEEIEVIQPAIDRAKDCGMNVTGPISGDIVFMRAFKGEFDVVITMFHDQGQIALKVMGFDQGVTIGGGLPYPITTAAHGTAFGRAGKGYASTTAFENAVKVLTRMVSDKK